MGDNYFGTGKLADQRTPIMGVLFFMSGDYYFSFVSTSSVSLYHTQKQYNLR